MAKAKPKLSNEPWEKSFYSFFSSELAERAGSYLSERATIAIHLEGRCFLFQRRDGKNTVTEEKGAVSDLPDVHFYVPPKTLRHLLALAALPGTGLGSLGVSVIEHLFHSDESQKIHFRVERGFLALWSKGYFSVLKAGGPEVASYLARWGFDSLAKVKEILKKVGR